MIIFGDREGSMLVLQFSSPVIVTDLLGIGLGLALATLLLESCFFKPSYVTVQLHSF